MRQKARGVARKSRPCGLVSRKVGDFSIEHGEGARRPTLDDVAEILFEAETELSDDVDDCVNKLLNGDILLCMEGESEYLVITARSYTTRAVTEPPTETVMRGPREGFIEDLKTNLSLLERRLKTPDLAIDRMEIGRRTKTNVAVCYLNSVAAPQVVQK